jgi:hypothetical protein
MSTPSSPAALAAVTALPPRTGGALPARFALQPRPGQDPAAVAAAIRADLADLDVRVSPLSALEHDILVLEAPGRTLDTVAAPVAFSTAYTIADAFDVEAAEPDLPTAYFPEAEPPRHAGPFVDEGLEGFPPGCWAGEEPDLEPTPAWALERIRVPQAWQHSDLTGRPSRGAGIVVAQPDTGVTAHAELQGVVTAAAFDVLTGRRDATDPLQGGLNPGHGTATASVVVSPESLRVVGSAPAARHAPVRAIESVVRIRQVTVARAIDWAVEHGAHVITMSLGGLPSLALHRALRRAVDADVIVLAAAGNCVRTVVWPARYDECIAVGGTNAADGMWRGSCRGSAVDVSAPAQNVYTARVPRGAAPGADVGQGQGTSFAVALTAGVAALWLAHHGRANLVAAARARGETVQGMFRRLLRASARRPAGWNPFELGAGIVDAHALLLADFDVDRDRESVEPPADPRERGAVTVASLVAEVVEVPAAPDGDLDWQRYGPELAAVLLDRQLADGEETPVAPAVTAELAGSLRNHRLRDWLGLDDAQAEVGFGQEPS